MPFAPRRTGSSGQPARQPRRRSPQAASALPARALLSLAGRAARPPSDGCVSCPAAAPRCWPRPTGGHRGVGRVGSRGGGRRGAVTRRRPCKRRPRRRDAPPPAADGRRRRPAAAARWPRGGSPRQRGHGAAAGDAAPAGATPPVGCASGHSPEGRPHQWEMPGRGPVTGRGQDTPTHSTGWAPYQRQDIMGDAPACPQSSTNVGTIRLSGPDRTSQRRGERPARRRRGAGQGGVDQI